MGRAEYLRPSSAATWVVCTGNIDMRAMFPDAPDEADSEVTEDGTACHWLAAEIWNGNFPQEGTLAPNARVLTDEMYEGVDLYHDVLRKWLVPVVCERAVQIPRILQGFQGTPDAFAYDPGQRLLRIADLKFGYRFVEVWENMQLICYACGLLDELQLDWATTFVEFTIVQPRCSHRDGPVRAWRVRAIDLLPYIDKLRAAATMAASIYIPNPGCGDCPGRHVCTALQNAALTALERAYEGDPHELSPQALGNELRLLKAAEKKIEARISGLEMQADALLRKGVHIPWWQLAASFARETWREGTEAAVITLAEKYFNVDIRKPFKAITPAQARKLLPSNIVAMYAHKPSTGVRLTKQDPYAARKAFETPPDTGG